MTTQQEIQYQIKKLKDVITHCKSRERANELQDEIDTLEGQLNDSCPSCGSYEVDQNDDLACGDEYHKSELERHYPGDPSVRTTSMYWDCECKKNYIHQKNVAICEECGADQDNQPDSRVSEVNEFLHGDNANSKWSEIKSDYTDENGVTSIDAFLTPDDNEDGKSIALIVNGEIYYKDYDATTDEYAQRVIKEACKQSELAQTKLRLDRDLLYNALANLMDHDLIKDKDDDHYLECADAIRITAINGERSVIVSSYDEDDLVYWKYSDTKGNTLNSGFDSSADAEMIATDRGYTVKPQAEIILTDDDKGLYSVLDKEKNEFIEKDFLTQAEAISFATKLGYETPAEEF